jgi:hypothetical protein
VERTLLSAAFDFEVLGIERQKQRTRVSALHAEGDSTRNRSHDRPGLTLIPDPSGAQWKVSDITGTCALVSIVTMVRLRPARMGAAR